MNFSQQVARTDFESLRGPEDSKLTHRLIQLWIQNVGAYFRTWQYSRARPILLFTAFIHHFNLFVTVSLYQFNKKPRFIFHLFNLHCFVYFISSQFGNLIKSLTKLWGSSIWIQIDHFLHELVETALRWFFTSIIVFMKAMFYLDNSVHIMLQFNFRERWIDEMR